MKLKENKSQLSKFCALTTGSNQCSSMSTPKKCAEPYKTYLIFEKVIIILFCMFLILAVAEGKMLKNGEILVSNT